MQQLGLSLGMKFEAGLVEIPMGTDGAAAANGAGEQRSEITANQSP